MGRLFTPFQQFLDKNGNPLSNGTLSFFVNRDLSRDKETFRDSSLTTPNANPIVLNGEGRLVFDVFGSGLYTIELKDRRGTLIKRLDDVEAAGGGGGSFTSWSATTNYNIPAFVVGSNGLYYSTLSNSNLGNDPVSSPEFWEEIRFLGVYNPNISYGAGVVTQTTNGLLFRSLVGSNKGNDPLTDTGANWSLVFDPSRRVISSATNLLTGERYFSTATATHTVPAAGTTGRVIVISWQQGTTMTLNSTSNMSVTKGTTTTDTTWEFTNYISEITLYDNGTAWEIK